VCVWEDYKIIGTSTTLRLLKPSTMGPLDLLNHLLNFVAPALVVGVLMVLASRFLYGKMPAATAAYAQAAINCVAGVLALVVGLVVFGRDGKMASYALMAIVIASSQWVGLRR
jgi:hypothetical protein